MRLVLWPQKTAVLVSLRSFVLEVAKQDILTKDGATLQIVAVVPEFLEGDVPEVGYSQQQEGGGNERRAPRPPGNWMLSA